MKRTIYAFLFACLVSVNLVNAQWSKVSFPVENGFNIGRLYVDGTTMWAGGTGRIFRSTDGGSNWTEVSTGLQSAITMNSDIKRLGDRVYASFSGNGNWFTYYTTDEGQTWNLDTAGWVGPGPIHIHTHKEYVLVRCESNKINYKKNTDSKWSQLPLPDSHRTPGAMYSIGDTLVLGLGYIAMTVDMGQNWIFRNSNPTGYPMGFFHGVCQDASNPAHLYANYQVLATSRNFLVRTTNNQISWDSIPMNIPKPMATSSIWAKGNEVYVAYGGSFTNGDTLEKIYSSNDGAKTWTNITGNLYSHAPFKFHSLGSLNRMNNYLYGSGLSPQGIVRLEVGGSSSINEEEPGMALKVYPNPVQDFLWVDPTFADLKIYDTSGRCLAGLKGEESKYDLCQFAPGYYLLEATKGNNHYYLKIVKQ